MSDKLLFILVHEKTYPLQMLLGVQFGLSQGRVNIWGHRLLPILQQALARMQCTPERDGAQVQSSALAQAGGADLVIDGTERRRQRPSDAQAQRNQYSGKKTHTDKNIILVNRHSQKVVYLSQTNLGKKHDKRMAEDAQIVYPLNATLGKDTGFQGDEPLGVVAWQPKKKTKGQDLNGADLAVNHLLASVRIVVEQSLAGVKRYRIVKDVLRNTKPGLSDLVMEVACALHNLRVEFRHPIPTFDIFAVITYSE
ncbi:MAG TPA: transposase family protein [Phototrophicaceae bacterium]|nr:transposase family protein [Phototrophicaceae bacterium]